MAREQDYGRLYCETLYIPAGSTATFLTVPGFYGFAVQYISGGSLSIGGPSLYLGASYINGSSFAANQLFTLANTSAFMINDFIGGFNLIATGATSVCSLARVFTVGSFGSLNNFVP